MCFLLFTILFSAGVCVCPVPNCPEVPILCTCVCYALDGCYGEGSLRLYIVKVNSFLLQLIEVIGVDVLDLVIGRHLVYWEFFWFSLFFIGAWIHYVI